MEPLVTESGRYLITQGVLGILVLVEGIVIWRLYADRNVSEREKHQLMLKNVEIMGELQRTIEERNRVLDQMSLGITDAAAGFKALASLTAAHHERLVDKFNELVRQVSEWRK